MTVSPTNIESSGSSATSDLASSANRVGPARTQAPRPTPGQISDYSAGDGLMAEAERLMGRKKWKDAVRVLESAERLRPEDPIVQERMAVSASHARDRTTTNRALSALTERNESRPTTWTTVAEVALANHRFEPADVAARKALEADPHLARAWFDLAASYAGRGWFDEATDCLRRAQHLDRSEGSSLGEWRVGRAVNWWAITKTPAAAVTLLSALFVGILGLAVGLSTPLLVREFRIRSLDDSYTTMAIDAWENEHRFRVLNALAVAGVIVAWVLLFTLTR